MKSLRVTNGKLGVLWCRYCGREVEEREIKPGTFKCERCGRLLGYKELVYPEGTIPVRDEQEEPVRLFEPGQVEAMLHEMNLEHCPPGCILVYDEVPAGTSPVRADGKLTLADLIQARKEIEMRDKGIIVVRAEKPEPDS